MSICQLLTPILSEMQKKTSCFSIFNGASASPQKLQATLMTISHLPTELLENIIMHVVPEGFESLAVTCRRIYAICIPFIDRHNTLRQRFRRFTYYKDPKVRFNLAAAFDLITRIAVEPCVARYVRVANLWHDRHDMSARYRLHELYTDFPYRDAVMRLFADSIYLKQAGLDWQEYYADMMKDLEAPRYSQHAAAFLLTLLPNVENLRLPKEWKPLGATNKLIDAVVRRANHSHLSHDRLSLAQVIRFDLSVGLGPQSHCALDWASPFLALPRVRSFFGRSCAAINDSSHKSMAFKNPCSSFATTLETVHLHSCCIDEVSIADFLKHTTRLTTLRYSHMTKRNDPQDWNICEFVAAIERETGSHLEGLSVSICELRGSVPPGRASMRGFQRLQKLELPLEIAICNMNAAAACQAVTTPNESSVNEDISTDRHEPEDKQSFMGDLVPASVSHLSLVSSGTDGHAEALDFMFRDFATKKESTLSALEEIFLTRPHSAVDAYKEQVNKVLVETEKAGVNLELRSWLSMSFRPSSWWLS
jgi:hypothetical protein